MTITPPPPPNTLVIDMMTEEAVADLILGLTQEAEV